MIIRSINSVFMRHSRWLFGIFTVIIIVSFLGFLTPGQFGLEGFTPWGAGLGTAFGEKVDSDTLRHQMYKLSALNRLYFSPQDVTPEQAFRYYAQLKAAERRGFKAGDVEVVEVIRRIPSFRQVENGRLGEYSNDRRKAVMADLARNGFTPDLVEEAVRDEIVIGKLVNEIAGNVAVTDDEAEQFFRQYNEKLKIKIANFNADSYLGQVKFTPVELQNYFDKKRADYRIPMQLEAELVKFPFSGAAYREEAAKAAVPAALEAFYKSHPELFSTPASKDKPAEVKPYASVKAEVAAAFTAEQVRELALQAAQRFAGETFKALDKHGIDQLSAFRAAAKSAGVTPFAAGSFAANADRVAGIESRELVKQLGQVYDKVPVSAAVPVADGVIVGFVTKITPARLPLLKEVESRVTGDFRRLRAVELARRAASMRAVELAKIADGAARARAFDATRGCRFDSPADIPVQPGVATPVEKLPVNGVSPAVETPDGAMLALMTARTPADPKEYAKNRELWKSLAERNKTMIAYRAFDEYLAQNVQMSESLNGRR